MTKVTTVWLFFTDSIRRWLLHLPTLDYKLLASAFQKLLAKCECENSKLAFNTHSFLLAIEVNSFRNDRASKKRHSGTNSRGACLNMGK